MKNPFEKNDKYEKLKDRLEEIIKEYSEIYKNTPYFDVANWLSADIQDAINQTENEDE